MGCGSSKEEKNQAAASADNKPQPIRKVRTNFSDIHYDEPASRRRDTIYAPSEIPESRRPTEVKEEAAATAPIVSGDGMLSPGTPASPAPQERRRSWYERYAANKMKADKSISDEDMKKVIGMDRAELAEWSKDKPVGPRQESLYAGNVGYMSGGDGG